MSRRDDLAVTVARNLRQAEQLGRLYRVAQQPDLDAGALREQLLEAAAHAAPVAAAIRTPADAEQFCTRLHGLAKLAMALRERLKEGAG